MSLANGATLRALLKDNQDLANVIFTMRDMMGMPKTAWTTEQKEWWPKANIVLGQAISDIKHKESK